MTTDLQRALERLRSHQRALARLRSHHPAMVEQHALANLIEAVDEMLGDAVAVEYSTKKYVVAQIGHETIGDLLAARDAMVNAINEEKP